MRNLLLVLLVVAAGIIAYTIGKKVGSNKAETKLINNQSFVKNIVELASLEVGGVTTFKSTNIDSSGGFLSSIKQFFAENTASISVPYTAKYGVAFSGDKPDITQHDSTVVLRIPQTRLLSLELHMDRMETNSRKGLLVPERDAYFDAFQKRLYAKTREQLQNTSGYLQQSRQRIQTILNGYYNPQGYKVELQFK